MPTASTSMAPLLDPRTTFSFNVSNGISTYFEERACKNEVPRIIDELGRTKDAEFGTLEKVFYQETWVEKQSAVYKLASKILFAVFSSTMLSSLRIIPFHTQPKSFCSIDCANKSYSAKV